LVHRRLLVVLLVREFTASVLPQPALLLHDIINLGPFRICDLLQARIEGEEILQVMHVEHVPSADALKPSTVQVIVLPVPGVLVLEGAHADARDIVAAVGVVLDVLEGAPLDVEAVAHRPVLADLLAHRVIEVVSGTAKGIDLELANAVVVELADEPIGHDAGRDTALRVHDQHHPVDIDGVDRLGDLGVAGARAVGAVVETPLEDALDEVENESVPVGY